MALKIGGTTVVNDSRALENITNIKTVGGTTILGTGDIPFPASAPSNHVGATGAAHGVATTSEAGFISSTDKTKLDGIAAGANYYAHPATHPASIITQDASNRFVTDAEKTAWNAKIGSVKTINGQSVAGSGDISIPSIEKDGLGTTILRQTTGPIQLKNVSSGVVTHDFSQGNVWYHTNIFSNFIANFINVPTTQEMVTEVTLYLFQSSVPYKLDNVQISGQTYSINWAFSTSATGKSNIVDVIKLKFIRTSSLGWSVLGETIPHSPPFVLNRTLIGDIENFNLREFALRAGWNGVGPINATITLASPYMMYSNSTEKAAFETGAGFPANSSITIINNGYIVGMGGAGGNGGYGSSGSEQQNGTDGLPGGPAIRLSTHVTIQNNGTIAGGGGGGGGGAYVRTIS